MSAGWGAFVRRLETLEEALPYVTVEQLCDPRRAESAERAPSVAEVEAGIADGRLFTDRRQRLDAASGAVTEVRLVRLNRRHPAVAAVLDALA